MADLSVKFCGIKCPNPFFLASAPPTNSYYQVAHAFDAGWGGVIWKTIGATIVNVSSRYSAVDYAGSKVIGLNNIELISDRTIEDNLSEMARTKKEYPNNIVIASLMVESKREAWHEIVKRTEDTGCDGLELNFGCPHGMSERGMGAAVGQVPDYACQITEWVKEVARTPVMIKLTPNITNIRSIGRAAKKGGADCLSLINTINSITGVDLDTFIPRPMVGSKSAHGGYCGPAVKPIALNLLHQISSDPEIGVPISGIGGISDWRDAVEFMLLGATTVQVCTAVMHHGFRIIDGLKSGLSNWMDQKGFKTPADFIGRSINNLTDWGNLDLNYKITARINQDSCIHCGLCYSACEDGCHQSIAKSDISLNGTLLSQYEILEHKCVGCNMCQIVCPVNDCISMIEHKSTKPHLSWNEYQSKLAAGEMKLIPPPEHS